MEDFSPNNTYGTNIENFFCITWSELDSSDGEATAQGRAQHQQRRKTYTNGFPVATLSSHLYLLEDFSPTRPVAVDPFRWIPQGLYYDLFDDRNEPTPVIDNVQGYTNLQFFNALDADIFSLQNYRVRLLQENGNNQQNQVIQLFANYGY